MDLNLSTEQKMLKDNARRFLEQECPPSHVREMEADEQGYSPRLWKAMAELGWLGIGIPEAFGGAGDFIDLCLIIEEMGRVLLPSPYIPTMVLGVMPVLAAGSEKQKRTLLPAVMAGEVILSGAILEKEGIYREDAIQATATRADDSYRVNGLKLMVPYADVADTIICAARTAEAKGNPQMVLLLLDGNQIRPGLTALAHVGGYKEYALKLDNTLVAPAQALTAGPDGWAVLQPVISYAGLANAAEMLGASQKVLEMTVDYAKNRIQFGRPIGSFQAVQFHCVDALADVEGMRYLIYQAAWKMARGLSCHKEIAMAVAFAGEAAARTMSHGHQVHAAISFALDHDLQLYSRRVRGAQVRYGDATFYREFVAQDIGLHAP